MPATTRIHRLPNGLRLATVSMPYMESAGIGIWTEAGSRHEKLTEHGMAHLVEHLLFKGTPDRSPEDISRQVERLGASLDAFTVEDHTCFHARGPAEAFQPLLEVMGDLYQNPVFDPKELESEKRVIREEIAMVRDQPSQHLEDLISEAAWGRKHPLGRSITGTPESLQSFSRDTVFEFFKRAYSASHTVISVAGKIDHDSVAAAVAGCFGQLAEGSPLEMEPAPPVQSGLAFEELVGREQCHLGISFRAGDRYHPDRFAQKILNVILGENMSSRLFQVLREKMGLCYEVQSDIVSFDDAGLIQIYLALDPENLPMALDTMSEIFEDLRSRPPSREEVEEAVTYCIGQSRIQLETVSSRMMWAGESLLSFDQWIEPDTVHEKLARVTARDVQEAAREVFQKNGLSAALAGPSKSIKQVAKWAGDDALKY